MTPAQLDNTDPVLEGQRHAFDVPEEVAYFNTANLAPHLHSVRTAGEDALAKRGRPWTIKAEDWFRDVERLRALFEGLIGADGEGVALVPATSYGFAIAAGTCDSSPGTGCSCSPRSTVGDIHVAGRDTAGRSGDAYRLAPRRADVDRCDPRRTR